VQNHYYPRQELVMVHHHRFSYGPPSIRGGVSARQAHSCRAFSFYTEADESHNPCG